MRRFVTTQLQQYYSEKWEAEGVLNAFKRALSYCKQSKRCKEETIKELQRRLDYFRKIHAEGCPLISYADIKALGWIITEKNNWDNIFSKHYEELGLTWGAVIGNFREAQKIRNKADHYHEVELSELDIICFDANAIHLLCNEEDRNEYLRLIEEERREAIEEIISSQKIKERKCKKLSIESIRPASQDDILSFYEGNQPTWSIIAANGDIRRDQEREVLERLLRKDNKFRIVCIVGEPGEGKSTFARRLCYELCKRGETVLHLLDNTYSEFWYHLPEIASILGRHFYILIDDIFRNEDFIRTLQEIEKELIPITIIATSRYSEYHEVLYKVRGLQRFIEKINLEKLSAREKKEFIKRIGKSYENLSSDERKRFEAASSFLILGMTMTRGKGFEAIIYSMIERLRKNDPVLYHALKYICFCYSCGISIPESLLSRLNSDFYKIIDREAAKGILYCDLQKGFSFIRVGHQVIAEKALEIYRKRFELPPPHRILEEILRAIDESNGTHRKFFPLLLNVILNNLKIKMLKAIENMESKEISELFEDMKNIREIIAENEKISLLLQYATIAELNIWRLVFKKLGRELQERVEYCNKEILSRTPTTTLDCQILISELLKRELNKEALYTAREWLKSHPEDETIIVRYLSLLKKLNGDLIKEAIKETSYWLMNHPEWRGVRVSYLATVREKGEQEDAERAIEETITWLENHPEDREVRPAFYSLVRDRGFHRTDYVKWALNDAEKFMREYGPSLFPNYLALVSKLIKTGVNIPIDIELVKQYGYSFLNNSQWDKSALLIEDFASFLSYQGFFDEAETIYEKLSKLERLSRKKRKIMSKIYFGYGMLFLNQAMRLKLTSEEKKEKLKEAEEKFKRAIEYYRGNHMAYGFLGATLKEQGKSEEAKKAFEMARWWAPLDIFQKRKMILLSSLPLDLEVVKKLNREIIPQELKRDLTKKGISLSKTAKVKNVERIRNRWKIINGKEIYLVLLEKNMKTKTWRINTYKNFSFGKLPYKIGTFYYKLGKLVEARKWFKVAIKEEPENFSNHWHLAEVNYGLISALWKGKCIKEIKQISDEFKNKKRKEIIRELSLEGLKELKIALEKASKPLLPPASHRILLLINKFKEFLKKPLPPTPQGR